MTIFSCLLEGFLSLFALIRLLQISTSNPITIILFAVVCFIYYQFSLNPVACRIGTRDNLCSIILAPIFSGLTILSKYKTILLNSEYQPERILILVLTFVGLVLIYYFSLLWLFVVAGETTIDRNLYPIRYLSFFTFLGSLIIFGFYFVIEYPGIKTDDTVICFEQINGVKAFNDDASIVYSSLLDKLYKLFHVFFNNSETCFAALVVLQLIFVSFIAAYVIKTLQKAHIHSKICVLTMLFYLLPFHGVMAVTLSRDVLLAANLCGYLCVIIRILLKSDQNNFSKMKWFSLIFPYVLFGFMICTLSRNGLVAFIVSLPFILLSLKEKWKVTIPTNLGILALVAFVKFPFLYLYEIQKPAMTSFISPTLLELFSNERSTPVITLLYSFMEETKNLWFPGTAVITSAGLDNPTALLHIPQVIRDTLLTMQSCIPLYGLLWSAGFSFWLVLICIFICFKKGKSENIPFLLPIFIFILTLAVMPVSANFTSIYPIFYALPLMVFLPFISAESDIY